MNAGDSYVGDVPSSTLAPLVKKGLLKATTDFSVIQNLDTINICVPTPLRKTKDPDMSYIVDACGEIAKNFHPGILVILESTTYPGTTRDVVTELSSRIGLPSVVREITVAELRAAPEIWLSFSTRGVLPVTLLDGAPVGDGRAGPAFRRLHHEFMAYRAELAAEP